MTNHLCELDTVVLNPVFPLDAVKTLSYPDGPDYIHQPIGTIVNQGPQMRPLKRHSSGHYVVPAHVAGQMRTRRFGLPASEIQRMGSGGSSVTVKTDFMDGNHAMHDLERGWDISRVCYVYGLATESPDDVGALYSDAEAAVVAVVGNRGSPGPMMSTGTPGVSAPTILQGFDYGGISHDQVKIIVRYRGYPFPTIDLGGALGHIESNLDAYGSTIFVSYTYPADFGMNPSPTGNAPTGDPGLAGFTDNVSKLIDRPVFEATVKVSFMVFPPCLLDGLTVNALAIASWLAAQKGQVNDLLYDPTGISILYPGHGYLLGAANCWLLEEVLATSSDGMLTFKMELTFHLRVISWNQTVTYTCRDTSDPPPDLVPGMGQKQVQTYPQVTMPNFVFPAN